MDSDTTTSDSVDSGVDETQLEDTGTQTEAVNEDEGTSQPSDDATDGPDKDNSDDAELEAWAASKNLPLDDPRKVAKMYREAEKHMHETAKKSKEGQLKSAVSTANEASSTEDYQALKNEVEALSFYVNHPDAKQYESAMVDILEEKPYLASDLDAVLDIAKGRGITDAATRLSERNAGKHEARTEAEQAGRAAPPRVSARAATSSNSRITPQNVDALMGQHMGDVKWYNAHKDEINAALA
jgi:hypothetical protein